MNFQPNTVVRLLNNVPLSLDNKNQMWFDNISNQQSYFASRVNRSYDNFTYQRKDRNYVSVETNAEQLFNVNYLMFQNSNFGGKWFYAFVTEIEYRSPNTSFVYYTIDSFQTWLFDLKIKDSFIEREHTTRYINDRPVINTIEENLNYGDEYKVVSDKHYNFYNDVVFILVTAKDYLHKLPNGLIRPFPSNIGNVPQGFYNYVFPVSLTGFKNYSYNSIMLMDWATFYDKINQTTGLVGKVVSLNLLDYVPLNVSINEYNNISMNNVELYNVRDDIGLSGSILLVKDGAFNSTTVNLGDKYNEFPWYSETKLMMYPYSYTKIVDMKGNEFDIKNEYIYNNSLEILAQGSISPSNKTSYSIKNYKNTNSILNGIINNNNSSMAIIDDYTAAYLQGNQNTLMTGAAVNGVSAIASTVANGVSGNGLGSVASLTGGISEILMLNAKMKDINNHPSNLRNQGNNYNFDFANNLTGFHVIKYTITDEYQKILSDFFKMYGYKVNVVKKPNLHTRYSWNYVKTVDIIITGNIPQDDMNYIKSIFNNGITLWHTADVGNYSLENSEL